MSDRTWNKRQAAAIAARGGSVVVSAAAGSGKTSVLTERILGLIIDGFDIENMLIVTFTNLAAGEMKERIFRRLMAAGNDDPRLAVQAEKCAFADISTIHAFCGRVVRDNFAHAGVLPTFAIADSAQTARIRQRAMDAAVAEMLADQHSFIAKYAPRGDTDNICGIVGAIYSRAVSQRDPQLWLDTAAGNFESDDFIQVLFREYRQTAQRAAQNAAMHIAERSDIWRTRGFDAQADMSECARIEMLHTVRDMTIDNAALPVIAPILVANAKDAPNKESKTLTNRAGRCFENLRGYTPNFADAVASELKATADDGRLFLDITRAFMKRYARAKRDKNVIDHDDTIHFALRALSDSAVAARYQQRYTHVFVDEYQDINDAQNAIITRIQRGGNDFLVGDVKQCIYTFRESNPELLIRRCHDLRGGGLIEMNTNYRSQPRIIDFINGVMHHMMSEDAGGVPYTGGHRLCAGRDGSGHADVIMADGADSLAAEAAAIGRYIRSLIGEGYAYKDIAVLRPEISTTGRQIAKRLEQMDIPVVSGARDKDAEGSVAGVFANLLALIARPVDDVALLSVMRYPHFGFTEPELAHIRIAQKSGDTPADKSYYAAAMAFCEDSALRHKVGVFWDEIDRLRRLADALPVPDFLMRVRHDAQLCEYALTSPDGLRSLSALDAFIAEISGTDAATLGGVLDIAQSAGFGSDATAAPGEKDAVYLTTIHKSKGLEFPVVILSGMHKKIYTRDTGGKVLVGRDLGLALDMLDAAAHTRRPTFHKTAAARRILHEKIGETVRLLYVGMTRAIAHLVIVGAGDSIKDKWQQDKPPGWQHDATTYFDLIMPAVHMMCRENGCNMDDIVHIVQTEEEDVQAADKEKKLDELFALAKAAAPADLFVRYQHEEDIGVPSKLSVSALKRRSETQVLRPASLPSQHDDISAAQRGTLMHKVLQKIGVSPRSEEEVAAFVRDMAQKGVINAADAVHVDAAGIARYLGSNIAARARDAERLLVEAPFCLNVGAREADVAASDENIIVQGVIDMCFLEDGAWVVVDYKTDRIDAKDAQEAAQKYALQLDLYAEALRRITDKKVRQKYIYFLETNQAALLP